MSEGSSKVRKSGSQKERAKSQETRVEKFGGEHSDPDSYWDNALHSAIKNKFEIENPTSEITKMEVHHHPKKSLQLPVGSLQTELKAERPKQKALDVKCSAF
jgi:hypothetical protein